jgi:hypothetical protein
MGANDRQVGGSHYGGTEYQHWDWVVDTKMHYLAGTASKYIARWRRKDGKVDLGKAEHYIDKAEESGVTGSIQLNRMAAFWRFVLENNVAMSDAMICWYIQEGEWEAARLAVSTLIERVGE